MNFFRFWNRIIKITQIVGLFRILDFFLLLHLDKVRIFVDGYFVIYVPERFRIIGTSHESEILSNLMFFQA